MRFHVPTTGTDGEEDPVQVKRERRGREREKDSKMKMEERDPKICT